LDADIHPLSFHIAGRDQLPGLNPVDTFGALGLGRCQAFAVG
jgi:hypothetical protein